MGILACYKQGHDAHPAGRSWILPPLSHTPSLSPTSAMASLTIRSLAASAVFLLASQAAAQQGLPTLYGEAWGGPVAVLEDSLAVTDPNNFDFVEATLVMPHLAIPKNPRNVSDQYTASYWIGMDGFSSPGINGLWQAGVIMSIWGNGTTTYDGFYEW